MINENNQYDVMALTKQLDRDVTKFNAFSLALSSVRSDGDVASMKGFLTSEQNEFDRHFRNLASLLGYTVSKTTSASDAAFSNIAGMKADRDRDTTAERDRLREENERLREASRRLMVAANDVDLGRSIHNSRKPDQAIEGPVWVILRNASAAVRDTLEGDK